MILPKLRPLNLEHYQGILSLGDHAKEVALLLHHQHLADDVGIEELTQSISSDSKITKHEAIITKLKDMVKEYISKNPKPPTLLKQGCLVSTKNAKIAPRTERVVNVRHSRDITFGNILKESEYFPGLFLVYFYQIERYFYCGDKVIKFEGNCDVTHRFLPGTQPTKHAEMIGIQNKSDDSFLILFHILNGKIHNIEGPPGTNLTIPQIVKLFKPFFSWMTTDKLYKFISKHRSKSHTKQSAKRSIGVNTTDTTASTTLDTPTKLSKQVTTSEFGAREPRKVSPGG